MSAASAERVVERCHDEPAAVRLFGVSKVFARTVALAHVDLRIASGRIAVVQGPNGAGKSTLLSILATVRSPTYGRGTVLGLDLRRERRAIRSQVELLGHATRLYEDLTPAEHLRLVARLHAIPLERVAVALDLVQVDPNRRIRELSRGMRQRVALARVHLRRPALLLLDEPYAGLDADARDGVDELVMAARLDARTVLVAAHDADRLLGVADLRVGMEAGRVVAFEEARR